MTLSTVHKWFAYLRFSLYPNVVQLGTHLESVLTARETHVEGKWKGKWRRQQCEADIDQCGNIGHVMRRKCWVTCGPCAGRMCKHQAVYEGRQALQALSPAQGALGCMCSLCNHGLCKWTWKYIKPLLKCKIPGGGEQKEKSLIVIQASWGMSYRWMPSSLALEGFQSTEMSLLSMSASSNHS